MAVMISINPPYSQMITYGSIYKITERILKMQTQY